MENENQNNEKLPCCKKTFIKGQLLNASQRAYLQYKNYSLHLSEIYEHRLKSAICAMLNSVGGTILLGIEQTPIKQRIVRGINWNEIEFSKFRQRINSRFEPKIESQLSYSVVPVLDEQQNIRKKYVIKIKIRPYRNYLFGFYQKFAQLFIYRREQSQCRRIVTPAQIYSQIFRRASDDLSPIHQCKEN